MPATTVDEAIDHALAAYARLTELAEEIEDEWSYVNDPHRAIDWLSTFPQVALLALGETP
jgi:hypothetical protein